MVEGGHQPPQVDNLLLNALRRRRDARQVEREGASTLRRVNSLRHLASSDLRRTPQGGRRRRHTTCFCRRHPYGRAHNLRVAALRPPCCGAGWGLSSGRSVGKKIQHRLRRRRHGRGGLRRHSSWKRATRITRCVAEQPG